MKDISINQRFIIVIDALIKAGIIKNKFDFSKKIEENQTKISEITNFKYQPSIDLQRKLKDKFNVSIDWLITGDGSMFKSSDRSHLITNDIIESLNTVQNFTDNRGLSTNTNALDKSIPLVSVKAIGGFGNIDFSISERDVKAYYVIPKFRHKTIDFMIEVEGSSMYPKYNSGDVVACTIIRESKFIQWNKTHVIATKEQGILIKRIKKSENNDTLQMVSDNKDYDPFNVPDTEITGIALVVGVIRLE